MKALTFITICLTLFALIQAIEENNNDQMSTVYMTVTASNYAGGVDKVQTKEEPTASSTNERAQPTVSSKAENDGVASSTTDDKETEDSMTRENWANLNDLTETTSPIPDTEGDTEKEEEKETNKPMRLTPEVSSEKDVGSDSGSNVASDIPSKPASRSGPALASGSASASKEKKSSSSSSSYDSAFTFSPITMAPESTKPGGAKATAPVMKKISAKTATVKSDKHMSSAVRVTSSSSLLFILALILCY